MQKGGEMSKRRRILNKGGLRELWRIKNSAGKLSNFLGGKSEEAAKAICSELLREGIINEFWHIPADSALDHRGIDVICKTCRGFFFINVKKSSSGVNDFLRQRKMLKEKGNSLHVIYPWRVIPELSRQEEAKADLEKTLNEESPSCDTLPENIKKELTNPTFPLKKLQKIKKNRRTYKPEIPNQPKTQTPTAKQRLEVLRKKLGPIIQSEKSDYFWEVTISAMIESKFTEINGRGVKREAAELDAYEKLSKLVSVN